MWISLGLGLVIVVIWLSIPWSWSTIDDAGFAAGWASAKRDGQTLPYGIEQVVASFQSDIAWGLFRPSYWLYPSLVYWTPIEIVHLIRLLMFGAAVAGPVFLLQRRGLDRRTLVMAALVIVSAGSLLTNGLFFLSLQELSGAAFVGMGLAARSHWWRIGLWVIAAWFKSPFSWLLLGEAVVQWRHGKRLQASVSAGFGLGTLVLGALFARSGNYTARYGLDPWRILTNGANLVEVWTTLVLVMLLWWLIVTQTSLRFTDLSLVLVIGFAGYTAQMLPWAVTGYYMGPIIYLLGLFLASMLTNAPNFSLLRSVIAFSAPVVIASYVLYLPVSQGLKMNKILGDITTCLTTEGSGDFAISGYFVYVTTEEGVLRMAQNAQLEDPDWSGSLSTADPSALPGDDGLVCTTGPINVYRL
jgi:hypothetical protein